MKICHFSTVHSIWDTRVFQRECVSLAKNHQVTLIAIGQQSGIIKGVKVIGIKKPSSFFKRFTLTAFLVFKEALFAEADIYHIHDAEMIPYGIVLALNGKKVVYDIHENTYHDILLKPWVKPWTKNITALAYNFLLRTAKHFLHFIVVVASPRFLKSFFVKEEECTIIQNFADVNQMAPYVVLNRSALPGNHLFYVGMIRDMYYEVDDLLEAMWILKKSGLETQLHLIGYFGNSVKQGFDYLPFWKEIEANVTYYGKLSLEQAYAISMQCKIGICLKDQPEDMLVSHERKLFEYMAVGLPAIFTHSHIYTALNQQCNIGLAVNLKSAVEIAAAIEALLLDSNGLNQKAELGFHWTKNYYNWETEYFKLENLYFHLNHSTRIK